MAEPADKVSAPGERESIADLCRALMADGKELTRAELARIRATVARRVVKGRPAIVYGILAALTAQAAIVTLLAGLLLFLEPYVGILTATAIVTLAALGVVGLLAWLAVRHIKAAFSSKDDLA